MDNKELIAELNRQALRVDENVHSTCERAAQALAAADVRIAELESEVEVWRANCDWPD